jgi:ubiquitin fusion degradation protein 1
MNVETSAPAPLNLPFGKLFFGYNITPYTPPERKEEKSNVCFLTDFVMLRH